MAAATVLPIWLKVGTPIAALSFMALLTLVMLWASLSPQRPAAIDLAEAILEDRRLDKVLDYAELVLGEGLYAGDIYSEVWIRDLNFFVEYAVATGQAPAVRSAIITFLELQGERGDIVDGYVPIARAEHAYNYRTSALRPDLAAFKNTTETDQESSLVQVVGKYLAATGDVSLLAEVIDGTPVFARLQRALEFLYSSRYSADYGLVWGATTADWGDVQPEHEWGVELDDSSHPAIDIYDNAMLLIALKELRVFSDIMGSDQQTLQQIDKRRSQLEGNIAEHLWDSSRAKYYPHIYLQGSPFDPDFDEERIYFHGGTTVAVEAGLLDAGQVQQFFAQVVLNRQRAGAPSVGLTLYPAYPDGAFLNPQMGARSYQNGGDWSWFGARLVQQMLVHDSHALAWRELDPMLERVVANDGFYEWYDMNNRPRGSGAFKGAAGALASTIIMLREWARQQVSNSYEEVRVRHHANNSQ